MSAKSCLASAAIVCATDPARPRRSVHFDPSIPAVRPEEKSVVKKKRFLAYLLWLPPLGIFGFHQFYLGRKRWGALYLLTAGLLLIGWIADLWRVAMLVEQINTSTTCRRAMRVRTQRQADTSISLCDVYLLLACPVTGLVGGHHYALGRYWMGVCYTCTLGLFAIGWFVDWFRLPCLVINHKQRRKKLFAGWDRSPGVDAGGLKRVDDAYLLWLPPLGLLGLHHYYTQRYTYGILHTCTLGLLCVGWFVDLCKIPDMVKQCNNRILDQQQQQQKEHHQRYQQPDLTSGNDGGVFCITQKGDLQNTSVLEIQREAADNQQLTYY